MNPAALPILGALMAGMSLVGFALMGADKRRAGLRRRRIPELALFLPALLGGALGSTLGMLLFRHKTRKWYFAWLFPLLAIAQLLALLYGKTLT